MPTACWSLMMGMHPCIKQGLCLLWNKMKLDKDNYPTCAVRASREQWLIEPNGRTGPFLKFILMGFYLCSSCNIVLSHPQWTKTIHSLYKILLEEQKLHFDRFVLYRGICLSLCFSLILPPRKKTDYFVWRTANLNLEADYITKLFL